jgi:hypothetical protein
MDKNLNPTIYESILVPFNAIHDENISKIWVSPEGAKLGLQNCDNKYNFISIFNSDSAVHECRVKKVLYAERYGGYGIANHAGGARCGIFEGLQIKGLGITPVAGKGSPLSHSTGRLNLIDGLLESVYSIALDKLLPFGAVKVLAVMSTNRKDAHSVHIQDAVDGSDYFDFGCLLIREAVLRPAHFMYPSYYVPLSDKSAPIENHKELSDFHNSFIRNYGGGESALLKFVEFLKKSAAQFAYSRVFGIMHGALSYSNYSLDSRWLDLACSTTLGGYINYSIGLTDNVSSFSEEAKFISHINQLFCWEYGKHIDKCVNENVTWKIYEDHFDLVTDVCCLNFWGFIGEEFCDELRSNHFFRDLIIETKKILSISSKKFYGSPSELLEEEKILNVVFRVFVDIKSEKMYDDCEILYDCDLSVIRRSFIGVFSFFDSKASKSKLLLQLAKVLRRLLLWPVLYRDRVITKIKNIVWSEANDVAACLLSEVEGFVEWAYLGEVDHTGMCLMKTSKENLMFSECFSVTLSGKEVNLEDLCDTVIDLTRKTQLIDEDVAERYTKYLIEIANC